jgi:predicted flavoprotein YhiN
MPILQRIAVIGGGPAGALCAAELASAGREILLFDEKLSLGKTLRRRVNRQGPGAMALSSRGAGTA